MPPFVPIPLLLGPHDYPLVRAYLEERGVPANVIDLSIQPYATEASPPVP